MSIKWISYIWERTDYRSGERLTALALADFANDEGQCFPKIETVARKACLSVRQVQRILKRFEADGLLEVVRKIGRGNAPEFQLKKVTSATPFAEREKVTSVTKKGDIRDTEKVTSVTPHIYEPIIEPSENRGEPEHPLAVVADDLAIQAVEKAFHIRLDTPTRKRVAAAVPVHLIDRFPAYISGRAVGWVNRTPSEKLAKIGYALTDFQKENNATAKPSYQQIREQQAITDHNAIAAIRSRVTARKLSGAGSGDSGGQLPMLGPKPDDGGEDVAG
jgi:hypothetical protein